MRINSILALILPFMVFSCSSVSTPPVGIPKAVPVTESVKPTLEKTQQGINSSIEENIRLQEKIKEQKQEVLLQKVNITDAIFQAEKIKEKAIAKELITELEVVNLIGELNQIKSRNLFLETKIQEAELNNNKQLELLELTRQTARKAMEKLDAKEEEAAKLQSDNQTMRVGLIQKNKEVTNLQKDKESLIKKAATAGVYRNWIIGLVVGFVLWVIVKNILMVYFPTTKFRV